MGATHEHVCPKCGQEWDCKQECGMAEVVSCGDCEMTDLVQIMHSRPESTQPAPDQKGKL
jgi:predicted  nucleic acid-binding Zn ribbon protein